MFKEIILFVCVLVTCHAWTCNPSKENSGSVYHCTNSGWTEICQFTTAQSRGCYSVPNYGARSIRTNSTAYSCLIYSGSSCNGNISIISSEGMSDTPFNVLTFSCPWDCVV